MVDSEGKTGYYVPGVGAVTGKDPTNGYKVVTYTVTATKEGESDLTLEQLLTDIYNTETDHKLSLDITLGADLSGELGETPNYNAVAGSDLSAELSLSADGKTKTRTQKAVFYILNQKDNDGALASQTTYDDVSLSAKVGGGKQVTIADA